ncbi:MAG TPA: tetratricopeptide repeat protein [Cyclobacteriaceae bacterium]|nr:tetratricopeptide repeat protein [Cyclobacteriaceae bacterium]
MKTIVTGALMIMLVALNLDSIAQCREFKWPEDKSTAEEKVALYGDAMKQGQYRAAAKPFTWMLKNAPDWHVKLYIDGADIYDNLAEKEKDPARKQQLVDSMLMMYDLRIKYCGDEVNVLNRKAYYAYKYNVTNKDKSVELLELFDRVAEISGTKMSDGNLVAYMTTVQANYVLLKNLSDEQILERYDKIISIANAKIKEDEAAGKTKDVAKIKEYISVIDDLLIGMVKVDCDFVKNNLEPKFRKTPNDIALAKKIFGFMLQGKCTDDPLWLEVGELINKTEPDFGLAKNMGLKHMGNDNLDKAEAFLQEALELATTPEDKGDMYLYLGSIQAKKNSKNAAREYYRKAAEAGNKEGYEKIGDLYYSSFNDCKKGANMAEDRLVYIAAYNMYARAGAGQKMSQAKSQFPSKEEIFLFNWKVGDTMRVSCWIGETVTIDTRD